MKPRTLGTSPTRHSDLKVGPLSCRVGSEVTSPQPPHLSGGPGCHVRPRRPRSYPSSSLRLTYSRAHHTSGLPDQARGHAPIKAEGESAPAGSPGKLSPGQGPEQSGWRLVRPDAPVRQQTSASGAQRRPAPARAPTRGPAGGPRV